MNQLSVCADNIRYGTAGWSYPDWNRIVYPHPRPRGFSALAHMAEMFDFIEVNTSFYRIPPNSMTASWVSQTDFKKEFMFWVKLHRSFTHQRDAGPDPDSFRSAIAPIAENNRLAGILAQFPYSFHCTRENRAIVDKLADSFHDYKLAVEFRHRSWNRNSVLNYFRSRSLVWTNIDQPVISSSIPLTAYVTHPDVSYLRLHGRNRENWFSGSGRDARYNYNYSLTELQEIAKIVRKMAKRGQGNVFVSGNNHFRGNAVKNLKLLREIMKARN